MRIGLFGGSFSPIHKGHVALASWIVQNHFVDEVWLLVSPQNPLKESSTLMPEEIRFNLSCAALEGIKGVKASDFEWSLPRPSYTWHTLQAIRKEYPKHEFSLIIGGDNWVNFHRWAYTDEILSTTPIFIYPRSGSIVDESQLPSGVTLLKGAPIFPYSSTDVRKAMASGKIPEDMLPTSVAKIIKETRLTQSGV